MRRSTLRAHTDRDHNVPSLVPVAVFCCLVMIILGALLMLTPHEMQPNWWRYAALAYGGQVATGVVLSAVAVERGVRDRELRWLAPLVLVVGAGVVLPGSLARGMDPFSLVAAAVCGVLAVLLGVVIFFAVVWPIMHLVGSVAPDMHALAPLLWGVGGLLGLVATTPFVVSAFGNDGSGTPMGQGLIMLLRVVGLPVGEVIDEGQLWWLRLVVALTVFCFWKFSRMKSTTQNTAPSQRRKPPTDTPPRTRSELRRRRFR